MSNQAVEITLDGVTLSSACPEALVMKVRRPLVGARRETFVDVPGRESAWTFTEEPGDRTMTIDLDLQATSFALRRAAVVALADWADTLSGRVHLIVGDQPDRYWEAVLASGPDVDELLDGATTSIDYRVGPYANATALSTESFSGSGGNIVHNWTAADEVYAYPVIELTGIGGNLDSPTVTLNGDTLSTGASFPAGQTCTINAINSLVLTGPNDDSNLTGAWEGTNLTMSSVFGNFGLIVPGANAFNLNYDGAATSVNVVITWRRRYR